MDISGYQQEHSKQKLKLYAAYLRPYLSILLSVSQGKPGLLQWPKSINIYDIFAGTGRDLENNEGSPLIALNIIKEVTSNYDDTAADVILHLNEPNIGKFETLQHNLGFQENVLLSQLSANEYLNKWQKPRGSINLFFLDPFGYTQLDPNIAKKIISKSGCETLIFLPLSFIFRFRDKAKPTIDYLLEYGITTSESANVNNDTDFCRLICNGYKNKSNAKYGYFQVFEPEGKRNKYALLFFTNNELGADKFLESQYKLATHFNALSCHPELGFINKTESEFLEQLKCRGSKFTNIELYSLGLEFGFFSKTLETIVKKLEKEDRVTKSDASGSKSRKGSYYINWDNYRKENIKVIYDFRY